MELPLEVEESIGWVAACAGSWAPMTLSAINTLRRVGVILARCSNISFASSMCSLMIPAIFLYPGSRLLLNLHIPR